MAYNFSSLPTEVFCDKILTFLDYKWILNSARLVCKEWDETCRSNSSFQFPITYYGDVNKLEMMMSKHSDALIYVNSLLFWNHRKYSSHDEEGSKHLELEKEFVSKLINLKTVGVFHSHPDVLGEIVKLGKLKEVMLSSEAEVDGFGNCPSQIKSFLFTGTRNFKEILLAKDWPLEKLELANCSLEVEDWIELLESESLKNLEYFNFNNCKLSSDNAILEKLSHLKLLKYLSFSMNEFEDDKLKYIGELINLKKLICSQSKLNDSGVDYLSNLVNLEELYLANNEIFGGGFFNFGKLQKLKTLFLTNNKIGSYANFLSSLSNLEVLDLSNNQVVDEGLEDFHNLRKLKWLNLINNKIGSVGANYLSQNVNLSYLDVSRNSIGEEGLKNFGNLKKLKALNLETNNIGNGIRYLSKCHELEHLNCNYNNICDGESVSECLQHLPNLVYLELSYNNFFESISNTGCFGKLINIERLEANGCGITDEGIIEFLTQLSNNNYSKKLTLDIRGNHFTNSALDQFIKHQKMIEMVSLTRSPHFHEINEEANSFIRYEVEHEDIITERYIPPPRKQNKNCSIM